MDSLIVTFYLVLFVTVSVGIHELINQAQPLPYMDEIFHIPQAIRYCNGTYDWDPKITTLPGLYIFSVALIKLVNIFSSFECNSYNLRGINILINSLNFLTIYLILKRTKPRISSGRLAFASFTISLMPLLYFFTFLYYTDALSTLCVLLMYFLYLNNNKLLSGLAGALAVLCRQTNIIWVFWMGLLIAYKVYKESRYKFLLMSHRWTSQLFGVKLQKKSNAKPTMKQLDIIGYIFTVLRQSMSHIAVGLGFLTFIIVNRGIVVGDRSAHEATLNIPQIFYFSMFIGFFSSPLILFRVKSTLLVIRSHFKLYILLVLLGLIIVHFNTNVHPYLLADNRHYPFYFWQRFFLRIPAGKYIYVPFNIYVYFWLWSILMHLDAFTLVSFSLCVVLNLAPQLLLEFRYFILPYMLIKINSSTYNWPDLISEFLLFTIINICTIYKFLYHPFVWNHTINETQRFMW